ncbi:hypothetical protein PIB30_059122 [Stylosanthes scabra]|uniref:Uncharacterized protein n=1 Tax=Stylosanthes scabra TaxID=79078 RepID=A0ABU6RKJ1_9FABA|nr:hypothetical protein [Stylosanthes scabra]
MTYWAPSQAHRESDLQNDNSHGKRPLRGAHTADSSRGLPDETTALRNAKRETRDYRIKITLKTKEGKNITNEVKAFDRAILSHYFRYAPIHTCFSRGTHPPIVSHSVTHPRDVTSLSLSLSLSLHAVRIVKRRRFDSVNGVDGVRFSVKSCGDSGDEGQGPTYIGKEFGGKCKEWRKRMVLENAMAIIVLSNFSLTNLANIIWGEAGENDDHIVPYPEGSEDLNNKKEWNQEAGTKLNEQKKPEAKTTFHERKIGSSSNHDTGEELPGSGYGKNPWPNLSLSTVDKLDQGSLGTEVSKNLSELSKLSSSRGEETTQLDKDAEVFQNAEEVKEQGDFVDYGWANIGSFDDLDRIFR